MQTKTRSLLEALSNQGVGIGYAVALYYFAFGFPITQGLATTAAFAVLGCLRSFTIRRVYDWWDTKGKSQ